MGVVGPGEMVKDLVLGCIQSWLNRFGKDDIVKMVSENFIDKEIFDALKCLCDRLGLDPPKARRNTMKQVAVKVWAAELYDTLMKEDNIGKLPEFVVSSQELQRVPLSLMSGANDIVPVCTKMNILEKKMEEMVDTVAKLAKAQVLPSLQVQAPMPSLGSYSSVLQGAPAGVQQQLVGTPSRTRLDSFGTAALALKRKQGDDSGISSSGMGHGQGAGGAAVLAPQPRQGGVVGGASHVSTDQPRQPRGQRKQCFGTSKVIATGRTDWAAPVEVFISNTSADITENEVREVLKLCAEDAKASEGNENLSDFVVKDVKCLTRPDIENPRTKCWRVSVPFRFKDYIMSDLAYPVGWCHRPFYPPKQKSKEELEAEQQAKKLKQNSM